MDVVSGSAQVLEDHVKSATSVMCRKIADIFKHESLWPFGKQYTFNVKEQRSLCLVFESLFGSDDGEWLAWEAGKKDIEVGYGLWRDFRDVAKWHFPEIRKVGFRRILVPFG